MSRQQHVLLPWVAFLCLDTLSAFFWITARAKGFLVVGRSCLPQADVLFRTSLFEMSRSFCCTRALLSAVPVWVSYSITFPFLDIDSSRKAYMCLEDEYYDVNNNI